METGNVKISSFSAEKFKVPVRGDWMIPEPSQEFVFTEKVKDITGRALAYLDAGYPVHFAGPAGTGKTTLAFHVAAKLGRPITLIHGDSEFGTSDLVGRDTGFQRRSLVDNYVHSVLKTEEEMKSLWMDNRLTDACRNGFILIYDEFTRSRPEANNILLSILAEGILSLPKLRCMGEGYLEVHPSFRAIFTSNPEEYVGTHKTQDALMDRMVTLKLDHYDRETEVEITLAKTGVSLEDGEKIVDLVREIRHGKGGDWGPSIRACLMIGKILARTKGKARWKDPVFEWVCQDVLTGGMKGPEGKEPLRDRIKKAIRKICKVSK